MINFGFVVVTQCCRVLIWIEHRKISKASLDGLNATTLLEANIYGPTGLTLHLPTSTLYWVDLQAQVIDSCHISGSGRRKVLAEGISKPIAITVFEDTIYWLEGESKDVKSVNRRTGRDVSTIVTRLYKPMDLVVVHSMRQPQGDIPLIRYTCSYDNVVQVGMFIFTTLSYV